MVTLKAPFGLSPRVEWLRSYYFKGADRALAGENVGVEASRMSSQVTGMDVADVPGQGCPGYREPSA